jgi:hypothetical protein
MSSVGELFITETLKYSIDEKDLKKINKMVKREFGEEEWYLEVPKYLINITDKAYIPMTGSTNIVVYVGRDEVIIGKVFWKIPKSQYYDIVRDYYAEFKPKVKVKLFKKIKFKKED